MSEDRYRTLKYRYELLAELEEREEYAAAAALIKVWDYAHLNAHNNGNRLKRLRKEIKQFDDKLMDFAFDSFVLSRPHWYLMETEGLANLFALSPESPAAFYKEIFEYVQYRQEARRRELLDEQIQKLQSIGAPTWKQAQEGSEAHALILLKQLQVNLQPWVEAGHGLELAKYLSEALGQ